MTAHTNSFAKNCSVFLAAKLSFCWMVLISVVAAGICWYIIILLLNRCINDALCLFLCCFKQERMSLTKHKNAPLIWPRVSLKKRIKIVRLTIHIVFHTHTYGLYIWFALADYNNPETWKWATEQCGSGCFFPDTCQRSSSNGQNIRVWSVCQLLSIFHFDGPVLVHFFNASHQFNQCAYKYTYKNSHMFECKTLPIQYHTNPSKHRKMVSFLLNNIYAEWIGLMCMRIKMINSFG